MSEVTLIILGIIWLVVGVIIAFMAGFTYKFTERFFPPLLLVPFGPLAIVIWIIAEKIEEMHK